MNKKAIVFAFLASLQMSDARGQQQDTVSANFWMQRCRANFSSSFYAECLSFIEGYRGAMTVVEISDPQYIRFACVPMTATNGQIIEVVNRHAAMNPHILHYNFNVFVSLALKQAFPCGTPNAPSNAPYR